MFVVPCKDDLTPIAMRMTKGGRKKRKKEREKKRKETHTHVSHPPPRAVSSAEKKKKRKRKKGNGDEITNAMELPRDRETRGINLKKGKKKEND